MGRGNELVLGEGEDGERSRERAGKKGSEREKERIRGERMGIKDCGRGEERMRER